jgi:hypothetical protein
MHQGKTDEGKRMRRQGVRRDSLFLTALLPASDHPTCLLLNGK